jgi:hypothetical protein
MVVLQLNGARQIAEEEFEQLVVGILGTNGEQVLLGSGPRGEARSGCGRKGSLFRALGSHNIFVGKRLMISFVDFCTSGPSDYFLPSKERGRSTVAPVFDRTAENEPSAKGIAVASASTTSTFAFFMRSRSDDANCGSISTTVRRVGRSREHRW